MLALVLQRFADSDSRTDNIPIAHLQLKFAESIGVIRLGTNSLMEYAYRFQGIQIVKHNAFMTSHEHHFAHFTGVQPTDVDVTDQTVRVAERQKRHVRSIRMKPMGTRRADPPRLH